MPHGTSSNGNTGYEPQFMPLEAATAILPFQTLEHVDEPRVEHASRLLSKKGHNLEACATIQDDLIVLVQPLRHREGSNSVHCDWRVM